MTKLFLWASLPIRRMDSAASARAAISAAGPVGWAENQTVAVAPS